MTKETVVHVTTLDQWKSVLDVWFEQGYTLQTDDRSYSGFIFNNGARYLHLNSHISYTLSVPKEFIEYVDFMKEQEKKMAKETYYVTQEQLDLIEKLKSCLYPLHILVMDDGYKVMNFSFSEKEEKALLRYLGGDTSIEFNVKEPLCRLWRIDDWYKVYMSFNTSGTPTYTDDKVFAFKATRENIEKHKTVSWEIEDAD